MTDDLTPDQVEDLREYIDREVRGGFTPVGDIPEAAVAFLDEGDDAALRAYAEQYTAEALVAHAEAEKTWPSRTDCDRLDAAFDALESAGILARQDFSCCQNCGHGEMGDLVLEAADAGRSARGYAFYHQQDTEAAVGGHGLYIAWGAAEAGAEALAAIGREVVGALRGQGLEVEWNEDVKQRIQVSMRWQRRRA